MLILFVYEYVCESGCGCVLDLSETEISNSETFKERRGQDKTGQDRQTERETGQDRQRDRTVEVWCVHANRRAGKMKTR